MRDAGPGGSNVSNDDCKSSQVDAGRRKEMQVVASSRNKAGDPLLHTAIYRLVRPATGYTDGYAYSTLRVMRDRNSEPEWVQCE